MIQFGYTVSIRRSVYMSVFLCCMHQETYQNFEKIKDYESIFTLGIGCILTKILQFLSFCQIDWAALSKFIM